MRATATAVYWSELRPDDGGRVQIVRQVLETDTGSIGDESRAAIAADVAGQPVRDGPAALRVGLTCWDQIASIGTAIAGVAQLEVEHQLVAMGGAATAGHTGIEALQGGLGGSDHPIDPADAALVGVAAAVFVGAAGAGEGGISASQPGKLHQ